MLNKQNWVVMTSRDKLHSVSLTLNASEQETKAAERYCTIGTLLN